MLPAGPRDVWQTAPGDDPDEHARPGHLHEILLCNMGDDEVTAGELKSRGYYQSSSVGNNLRKLVEMGYMHHQRSEIDRRSVRVSLTDKGRKLRDIVGRLFATHAEGLLQRDILDPDSMDSVSHSLKRMERYWSDQIRYIY